MANPTIADTIEYGDVSTYLIGNNNSKGNLFGKRLSAPGSMVSVAMITDALRWGNDGGAQTTQNLRAMANYLLWLIGMFGQQAQAILEGSGGGSVTPIVPGGTRGNYYVIVTEATSTDPDDGSPVVGSFVFTDSRLVGATQLAYIIVNSSIETIASGLVSFDAETGTITRLSAWQTDDTVQIPFVMA